MKRPLERAASTPALRYSAFGSLAASAAWAGQLNAVLKSAGDAIETAWSDPEDAAQTTSSTDSASAFMFDANAPQSAVNSGEKDPLPYSIQLEAAWTPPLTPEWLVPEHDTDGTLVTIAPDGLREIFLASKKSGDANPEGGAGLSTPRRDKPAKEEPVVAPAPTSSEPEVTTAPAPTPPPVPVVEDTTTTTAPTTSEPPTTPTAWTSKVSRTADFIDSLGVNTHLGNATYADTALVLSQLDYIGISRIRDWFPEQIWREQYAQISSLASAGVTLNALLPNINPVDLATHLSALTAFARAFPGTVISVEGVNEIDASPIVYRGLEGVAAAEALQRDLYAAVHSSPDLAGIPVYNFTTGWLPQSSYGISDMSAYADFANVHGYVPRGLRPSDWLPQTIEAFASNVPNRPIVVTETNYYTLPGHTDWGGVNYDVQAKYGLYTALANWNAGISATFFYELRDQGRDFDREKNFGLFLADGRPKPFATALHNLISILSDTGPQAHSFDLRSVNVSFSGLPDTATAQIMQKSDGTTNIVIWDEQQIWDYANSVQLAATSCDVTVFLERSFSTVHVFDALAGSSPVATYHDISRLTFELWDSPLVIQVI